MAPRERLAGAASRKQHTLLERTERLIPLIGSVRELEPGPRKVMWFVVFNMTAYQCVLGPALLLLARGIGMPSAWVGVLISFPAFAGLMVVLSVPLVSRYGSKQLMMSAWLARTVIAAVVLLLPWVGATWGVHAQWGLLLGEALLFACVGALGSGGYFPWLHEIVSERQRGAYFSTEAGVAHIINVLVILGQALLLRHSETLTPYMIIYAVGVVGGLASVYRLCRIPGGKRPETAESALASFAGYRDAITDKPFRRFFLTSGLCVGCLSWLGSAVILYLRDVLHFPAEQIMYMTAAGSLGVLLTVRFWGRYADHSGSGRALFNTLTGHSLVAFCFLLLWPGAPWLMWAVPLCIVLATMFGAAFFVVSFRAVLSFVKENGKVAYTSTWTIVNSIVAFIVPILVGIAIEYWGIQGFRLCFLISAVGGAGAAVACSYVARDSIPVRVRPVELMNPALPFRTLARIMWITIGLHESNRSKAA